MRLSRDRHCLYAVQPDSSSASPALTIAGLDISAGSVRMALIELRLDSVKIISRADAFLPQGVDLGNPNGWPALHNSCRQALQMAQEGLTVRPESLVIGLSGDLIKSITQVVEAERSNPRSPLSPKEVDSLLLNNQMTALKRAAEELRSKHPGVAAEPKLLNNALISFTIDGRQVANPLNQPAEKIAVGLYNVFIPNAWLAVVQKIATNLNLNLLSLAYKPFAIARGLEGSESDALLINVEDEITDVGLIRGGVLTRSGSFGIGWRAFDRTLIRNFDFSQALIDGLKTETADLHFKTLDAAKQPLAERVINHTAYIWLQALTLALKDFRVAQLPAVIHFSGAGAGLSVLPKSIKMLERDQSLAFAGPLTAAPLSLSRMAETAEGLKAKDEFSLTALAGLGRLAGDILNVVRDQPFGAKTGTSA